MSDDENGTIPADATNDPFVDPNRGDLLRQKSDLSENDIDFILALYVLAQKTTKNMSDLLTNPSQADKLDMPDDDRIMSAIETLSELNKSVNEAKFERMNDRLSTLEQSADPDESQSEKTMTPLETAISDSPGGGQ